MQLLLEIHYLPCIQYFSKWFLYDEIVLDDLENFGRQSYRNRCYISAANGKIPLIIPIKRSRSNLPVKNVEIDNSENWQRVHWLGIQSAYGKSPFFEHYAPYLKPFYEKPQHNLLEFNLNLIRVLLKLLKLPNFMLASEIEKSHISNIEKMPSEIIHPKTDYKQMDKHFSDVPYMQVFMEKHGFLPNLSILDLLFNEGPEARRVLERSVNRN